ncbi:MAG: D-alanyl-D-alanine carboxypeptidase [Deltaproteobacteria bacterium]|nr:D-alanyl-D-alanine carboxypeptidase [Deltaproteobacteria bacterium]
MHLSSKSKTFFTAATCRFLLLFCLLNFGTTRHLYAEKLADLNPFIGDRDAILVSDPQGRIVFSKNADIQLVPASTLKIFTALVALHYLGPDYRFVTEFYQDHNSNLKVKGYGDPLLISEALTEIAHDLTSIPDIELNHINDLVLDDSYFKTPIAIPGVNWSNEPYDATIGALCVNFNTVNFKRNPNGIFVSAEAQTPLLPFVQERIDASQLNHGRILFSSQRSENTLYSGHLLLYFLKKEAIQFSGMIKTGKVQKDNDKLICRYVSSFSLMQVISKLFEYSNNFMANQLLITCGAKAYGPPGTLEKGVQAASAYAKNILKIDNIRFVEGSGISRKNRMSAVSFYKILKVFALYHFLMRRMGKAFYKTGTLKGIHTRAGYIENKEGSLYSFVVLVNTPGKSPKPIMDILLHNLD